MADPADAISGFLVEDSKIGETFSPVSVVNESL
jgi:hypothetical protein